MTRAPRIALSAGEASGDRLGAGLAAALRRQCPGVELVGMGGPRMAAAGVRLVQRSEEVAVVGFSEVLVHLPALRRAMERLGQVLERERPDLLVPIDFPDFNLRLARRARRAGVGVVYYVSPQVWAWRRGRIRAIRRMVRRMLVLFPFEVEFYERAGVAATFVGHPVAEQAEPPPREELCARIGLDPGRDVLALVPGSRAGELARHLPPMLDAASILGRTRPGLQWLIPLAPGLPREAVAARLRAAGLGAVRVHEGDFPEVLAACRVAAVASGTASLETAMIGLPMVVVYRMSAVSYALARLLVRLPSVALPNLIAGRRLVPELIQGACTGPRIAEALARFLDDEASAAATRAGLLGLRARLEGPGAFERAARAVLEQLERDGRAAP
jgi:lipid-A-disaccharide synthase